ncbi:hypothetical protein ACIBJF_44675 [Streptomyces sp. NPDC050743]|uniref:hypothetical protein n=1 Tax=Streptomyces sp. NPDC050743 TaxID=3365634 RepID=UPI003798B7E8
MKGELVKVTSVDLYTPERGSSVPSMQAEINEKLEHQADEVFVNADNRQNLNEVEFAAGGNSRVRIATVGPFKRYDTGELGYADLASATKAAEQAEVQTAIEEWTADSQAQAEMQGMEGEAWAEAGGFALGFEEGE